MALPRTPLAPDPGYENTSNFYPRGTPFDPTPSGRVRPEAASIARAHTSGSVGLLFETMGHPPMSKSKYKWQDPKNFAKENLRKIRQIQVQTKKKQEEKAKPVKAIHKTDKYDHIQPKVTLHIQGTRPSSAPSPGRNIRWGPVSRCDSAKTAVDRRVPVNGADVSGRRSALESRERTPSKNFVSANISTAARGSVKRPPSRQRLEELETKREKDQQTYQRGTVPQYLRKRQDEWRKAEQERIASLPDPSIPPGHTLMPAKERLKTLQVLREHQSVLTAELNSLPLQSTTLRVKQKKSVIERKLSEIEDALKIFTRPKVFVKSDE